MERSIHGEVLVAAPIGDVWRAWTDSEEAVTFFGRTANIEPWPGGAYEILFDLDAERGSQGGEGMIVLAVQEPTMLSFTWNAPPTLPEARGQMTHVTVRFEERGDKTNVTLHHDGWGDGGQWEDAFDYFTAAWLEGVLPKLERRFVEGPRAG